MTFEEKVESGIIYKSGDEWIDMDEEFDFDRPPLSEEEKRRLAAECKKYLEVMNNGILQP